MKKIFLTIIIALMAVLTVSAQSSKESKEKIYDVVEVMPEYPGGWVELMKYLRDNIKYPAEAAKRKEQGRVIVGFVIERNGKLGNISVLRHATPLLDEAAIEVVKKMPKWKPGKINGKNVRVKYQVPVQFRLN